MFLFRLPMAGEQETDMLCKCSVFRVRSGTDVLREKCSSFHYQLWKKKSHRTLWKNRHGCLALGTFLGREGGKDGSQLDEMG